MCGGGEKAQWVWRGEENCTQAPPCYLLGFVAKAVDQLVDEVPEPPVLAPCDEIRLPGKRGAGEKLRHAESDYCSKESSAPLAPEHKAQLQRQHRAAAHIPRLGNPRAQELANVREAGNG